MQENFPLH